MNRISEFFEHHFETLIGLALILMGLVIVVISAIDIHTDVIRLMESRR